MLLASASTLAEAAPPRSPSPDAPLVGFTPHGIHESKPAERELAYRRLRRAGVGAVRLDVVWSEVERADGRFDFSRFDREIRLIKRAGLRVIGLLGYGHPRYSSASEAIGGTPVSGGLPPFGIGSARHFPPDEPAPFARFAAAAARHYGREIVAWEVWNEQNLGWRFWSPREDPAAYGRLLCATRAALKKVDRRTPVVFGGVFFTAIADQPHMSGPTFLDRAFVANPRLGKCFDAVAYHPYAYPFTAPELDVPIRGAVLAAVNQMRAVLERHRAARKPLWITEIGWPTHDGAYGVSEDKQAQYVARMQVATFAQGVPVLNWYTYGDQPDPSGANQEAHFGFFREDGAPKAAYRALATASRVLEGLRFARDLSRRLGLPRGRSLEGGRGFALEFRGFRRTVTAVWLAPEGVANEQGALPRADRAIPVRLPVSARRVRLVDHLGGRRTRRATGGLIQLEARPAPVYVVERR